MVWQNAISDVLVSKMTTLMASWIMCIFNFIPLNTFELKLLKRVFDAFAVVVAEQKMREEEKRKKEEEELRIKKQKEKEARRLKQLKAQELPFKKTKMQMLYLCLCS